MIFLTLLLLTNPHVLLICIFVRYVDDTLAVFDSAEEADRFLTYLNNLHSSIQFTIDKESHDKLPL